MLFYVAWVLLSFFGVIGVLSCILGVLELLSLRRSHSVRRIFFRVILSGEEPNAEYLLNTLQIKLSRLNVGAIEPTLEVIDGGLSPESYRAVVEYCEKNPWVLFTEAGTDDII